MNGLHNGKKLAKYYRNEVFWDEREIIIKSVIWTIIVIAVCYWVIIGDKQLYIDGVL